MFFKKTNDIYTNSFSRSLASMFDVIIVTLLRILTWQLLVTLWLKQTTIKFAIDFKAEFGTETVKNVPSHINFIAHHDLAYALLTSLLIILLVGAFYHAILNSSKWQGTLGKRLAKIIIVNDQNHKQISFEKALAHYFLSILPCLYVMHLIIYQITHKTNFYETLLGSKINIFFGIIFIAWLQAHLFTKKRTTAYDMICSTVIINGKTNFTWPFSKKEKLK